jgi:cytochrome c553
MNLSVPFNKVRLFIFIALLFSVNFYVYSNDIQAGDSVLDKPGVFKAEELTRGERLFYGLVYQNPKAVSCASCHNTGFSNELNWNPDAVEISRKYLSKSAADLSKVLLNPAGEKMAEVHLEYRFSPEDIVLIKAYMDKLAEIGLQQSKPVVTNLFLFIIASLLLLISTTDLIISKKIKRQWIHFIVIIATGVFITNALVVGAIAVGHSTDYEPDQPVKFSHEVHAGQNGTDCIYCHSFAHQSKSAGFPPVSVCMNCHLLVRNGNRSGMFEIAKVVSSYEEMKPLEWIKVYNLPDHVFFSHAQHVEAGGLNCRECHGPVEEMDRIKLNQNMTMGWCIECHRTRNVNFRDNRFYSDYKVLAERIRNGEADSVTVERIGGTECMKCHY